MMFLDLLNSAMETSAVVNKQHKIVNIFEITPISIWKNAIINGFIHSIEIEWNLITPLDLCDLIMTYCDL